MKNAEYWKTRAVETILMSERSVVDYEKRLQQVYDIALINIRKEINAFFSKYATNNKVTYAEARRRLTAAELKPYHVQLKEWYRLAQELNMSPEFKQHLKEVSARTYVSRMMSLETSIMFEMERLATEKIAGYTDLLSTNYLAAYYSNYYTVSSGLQLSVNFATIDKGSIDTAIRTRWDGANYSDRIWRDKTRLIQTMEKVLPQSFSRGLSSNELGDMIAKELNTSKNYGRTLARTEVNNLCNQSSLRVYQATGLQEYEYLATLDMRTSDICRDLDGFIGKVSLAQTGVNYPPMHPNCRSTTIPYFPDDEDDIEDRIARDEEGNNIKVPRKMTQEEWIKKYVPKEQQQPLLKFRNKYRPKA